MDFKDYYETLGLNKEASEQEIKTAFKKLAKKHHPDTQGGSEAKFKEINEAHEVLKDTGKRSRYDFMYRNLKDANSFNKKTQGFKQSKMYADADSFKDIYNKTKEETKARTSRTAQDSEKIDEKNFSDFFEKFFGKHRERMGVEEEEPHGKTEKGDDFEMEVELSLEDAYHGCARKIEISATKNHIRRLEVSIPPGVKSGTKIKVAGEGKPGKNNGPHGDLFLKIKLKEHDDFWLEDYDVHSKIKLEPYEAVLGCTRKIPTLEGQVELVIPPNSHYGRVLRLRSKGMKNPKGEIIGDHYVQIIIDIPQVHTNEEMTTYKYLKEQAEKRN